MAKLLTHHDPAHLHATLGSLCLLQFLFRLFQVFAKGTAFPSDEPVWLQCVGVGLHGCLSWSSLLLPLPAKRNFSSPMIWHEARLHTITFSTRHVVATIITLLNLWPQNVFLNAAMKLAVVLAAVFAAKLVTDKLGDKEKRTTNSMPYPAHITEDMQKKIKKFYAHSQFGATVMLMSEEPTLCYTPLLAIQAAPLLMTLVRKGKINAMKYHQGYAFTLWVAPLVWFRLALTCDIAHIASSLNAVVGREVAVHLRLKKLYSTELSWALAVVAQFLLHPLWLQAQRFLLGTYADYFFRGFIILGLLHTLKLNTKLMYPAFVKYTVQSETPVASKES